MCRFAFYMGPAMSLDALITRPVNSIIHQSFDSHERSEPLNGDGFGVAWYPGRATPPALFRSISPAWSNRNLRDVARVTASSCVLAHVRAASPGLPVIETNCHPFVHDGFAFMHNGSIGGFRSLRRRLLATLSDRAYDSIEGTTDSELFFALVVDALWHRSGDDVQVLRAAVDDAFALVVRAARDARVDEVTVLNTVITDGQRAVASRLTTAPEVSASLYVHSGKRYVCRDQVCSMVEPEDGKGAVLVCSEPLSDDPGWEPVPVNHHVTIDAERKASVSLAPSVPVVRRPEM